MLSYTHNQPYHYSDNHIWLSVHPVISFPIEERIVIVVSTCPVIWLYAYLMVPSLFPIRVCYRPDSGILINSEINFLSTIVKTSEEVPDLR